MDTSIGYRINNSTGDITSLEVIIDQVNASGAVIQNIYTKTTSVAGVANYTYENLNGYCISSAVWGINPGFGNCSNGYSGYTGYFAYSNGLFSLGNYYKLTVSVSNLCGSSTQYSYLYASVPNGLMVNDENFLDFISEKAKIFPNPFTSTIEIEFEPKPSEQYQIELVDVLGRKIVLLKSAQLEGSTFNRSFDTSNLAKGMYIYNIKSHSDNYTGLIYK
ncbi:T9SS type A sorting domain-containing protein [Cryomorpha ignava]|uniref:T9SS type A sorting domain-containing protein n=1 Tax=Cryomorpha ignava TaxID=101383 RepID=A0A7K3WMG0_9FLAO|nr:T9SS type A sorting domain-containing protein [Cryomorpha ignava]NEN21885.1 T9SS type A sorting domain-containing protein [Cryomorpha ignava]